MDSKTKQMILTWLEMHNGDKRSLARWMRDSLRIGGFSACLDLIEGALT